MKAGLGTQLRHLLELLDGAVEEAYSQEGIDYRPRFTPIMRALIEREPSTVGQIAMTAGITQPAVTQTVALMVKAGLVAVKSEADDRRQRMIHLTPKGRTMLPRLQACWRATSGAAEELDAELPMALSRVLEHAIAALEAKPFGQRIAEARQRIGPSVTKDKPATGAPEPTATRKSRRA
ncbi:MarR family transcriptional regulator [Corallococcus sp. M34]|uniref:MarR family winged helix-turn-helix transcriptional regulator n=1 Tax=Citreicoccus inhibens TaxID=2849499 RepID=UPI001C23F6EB|nr:MarR family transcriptional regulator [Citreicoccus inhibens]MBU8896856.1 MarR family transcriptional regulator [Citreicoccus inhibens]